MRVPPPERCTSQQDYRAWLHEKAVEAANVYRSSLVFHPTWMGP